MEGSFTGVADEELSLIVGFLAGMAVFALCALPSVLNYLALIDFLPEAFNVETDSAVACEQIEVFPSAFST